MLTYCHLFYFQKGKNAVQVREKLSEVYGEDCLTGRLCQLWFARFRSGNLNVRDTSHSGPTITSDGSEIKALI